MKAMYISGPVSGRAREEAAEHFEANARRIRAAARENGMGMAIVSPLRICRPSVSWDIAMRQCIGELIHCDGIAMLQGWQHSRGAKIELALAHSIHIPVVYVEPPAGPMDLSELFITAPETLRYYNARLAKLREEGVEESLAEERAASELANRYLDPYGFEYRKIREE